MGWFSRRDNQKTAEERKQQSMNRLRSLGYPVIDHLPTIEEEGEARIRTAQEIAERILVLVYLNYVAEVPDARSKVLDFLEKTELWSTVSPQEKELFSRELSKQEKVDISWRTEGIWVMLWTISKVPQVGLPTMQVKAADILKCLPEFMSDGTKSFARTAQLRPVSDILDLSDLTYRLHWAARDEDLNGQPRTPLILSAVREQHYAINWITYYADDWDEVTTDT